MSSQQFAGPGYYVRTEQGRVRVRRYSTRGTVINLSMNGETIGELSTWGTDGSCHVSSHVPDCSDFRAASITAAAHALTRQPGLLAMVRYAGPAAPLPEQDSPAALLQTAAQQIRQQAFIQAEAAYQARADYEARAAEQPEPLEDALPDTKFYRGMAAGHQLRKGHALQAVLVSTDGGSLWHQVNKCCQSAAEEQQP